MPQGGKVVTIPLAPRTARAIDLAIGERLDGPIFLDTKGERLDRHAAGRIVRRLAGQAGINKPVGPHTLRHAFITAVLDAGVPLRDVQEAASHADPRTTMRYDRARASLDRHATYIVAAFIAGAARQLANVLCPTGDGRGGTPTQSIHNEHRSRCPSIWRGRSEALQPRTVVPSGTTSHGASGVLAVASALDRHLRATPLAAEGPLLWATPALARRRQLLRVTPNRSRLLP